MVRDHIARSTLNRLSTDPFLGSADGIWVQERRFDLARRVLRRGSLFHGDLPAEEVRRRAAEIFDDLGRNREASISFSGGATYLGAEFDDVVSWIDATAAVQVVSHLPEGDVPQPATGWVWDFYSPRRLMEFEVEVYGRACQAYDEALAHAFARLGWSMPSSALAPFGVRLEVQFDDGVRLGNIPVLTVMRVPMALMAELAPRGPDVIWSASGRAVVAKREGTADWTRHSATLEPIRSWLAQQNRESIVGLRWTNTGADDMSDVRPASSQAARWLWEDLQSLGLGTGAGNPRLS
jgi:hypothetical protein